MAVRIVFPDGSKKSFSLGVGTKFYDDNTGQEITDVFKANISMEPDDLVMVHLSIPVSNLSEFFGNTKE